LICARAKRIITGPVDGPRRYGNEKVVVRQFQNKKTTAVRPIRIPDLPGYSRRSSNARLTIDGLKRKIRVAVQTRSTFRTSTKTKAIRNTRGEIRTEKIATAGYY